MEIKNELQNLGNEKEGIGNEKEGIGNEKEGIGNEKEGIGNEKEGIGNEKEGIRNEKKGTKMNLIESLESKNIEARYKSVLLNLRSKFDIPDDLTDKVVKIIPNDSIQDKFYLFPRATFSDNGIYIVVGSSIYMFRNLGNRWENVSLPKGEGKYDWTGGHGVEMNVNKICKNVDNCSVEIGDKKDDLRLK